MTRLTPAQRRSLALLARPGAEARPGPYTVRWSVVANQDGIVLGTIHAETLRALRTAGLVGWYAGDEGWNDYRHRISAAGRRAVLGAEGAEGRAR